MTIITPGALNDGQVTNAELVNDSVTVAGNTVALGASTDVNIFDLADVSGTHGAGKLLVNTGAAFSAVNVDTDDFVEGSTNLFHTTQRAYDSVVTDFDFFGNSSYPASGIKIENTGTNRWTGIEMREYGSSGAPFNIFNPSLQTLIGEGTSASPTAVGSGYRLFTFGATAHYDATIPSFSNGQMQFVTTEAQTSTARGTKLEIYTTENSGGSSTARKKSLEIQDKRLILNPDETFGGSGFELEVVGTGSLRIKSDTLIDEDLEVTGNLQVDGNTTLGNANTDTVTVNAVMSIADTGGLKIANITKATADYLDTNGFVSKGGIALITDGSRADVPIFYDGSDWRYFSDSTVIAS